MEFRERLNKICQVKHVIIFCLGLLFLWWGCNAVLRYWSQPMSTDVSFKYGETKQGIQFPLITLCSAQIFIDDPMIEECYDGSRISDFISTLISCIKRNKTSHVQIFHPELRDIVEMVKFYTGSEYVNLHHGTVWTKVFHHKGPCYTLDI